MMTGNIHVRIGSSPIDGTGVFAAQPITKDTWILEYTGEKIARQEATERFAQGNVYIFFLGTHPDIDGNTPTNPARYINHSCDPNADVLIIDGFMIVFALHDILPGEEITVDYLNSFEEDLSVCQCRTPSCRQRIVHKAA